MFLFLFQYNSVRVFISSVALILWAVAYGVCGIWQEIGLASLHVPWWMAFISRYLLEPNWVVGSSMYVC